MLSCNLQQQNKELDKRHSECQKQLQEAEDQLMLAQSEIRTLKTQVSCFVSNTKKNSRGELPEWAPQFNLQLLCTVDCNRVVSLEQIDMFCELIIVSKMCYTGTPYPSNLSPPLFHL